MKMTWIALAGVLIASQAIGATNESQKPNPSLWARISIDPVYLPDQLRGRELPLGIHLCLVNDGDQLVKIDQWKSKIIVNGQEMEDNDFILGNGRVPIDWLELGPHEVACVGRNVAASFQKPGIYRVSWKGDGFESPEVIVRVLEPGTYTLDRSVFFPKRVNNGLIIQKLNELRMPELNMEDKTIEELAEILTKESVRLDPKRVGVKIELRDPKGRYASRRPSKVWNNVYLANALRNITDLAGLKYDIEEDRVVIHE